MVVAGGFRAGAPREHARSVQIEGCSGHRPRDPRAPIMVKMHGLGINARGPIIFLIAR